MSEPETDPLDRIIGELETELAPLASERAQLESRIAELLRREQRIKAGIQALKSGAPAKKATTKAAAKSSHDWVPAQHTLDQVYALIAQNGEPMTLRQLEEACELSGTTIKKVLEHLRSTERIRVVGTASSPGSPRLYGVMP